MSRPEPTERNTEPVEPIPRRPKSRLYSYAQHEPRKHTIHHENTLDTNRPKSRTRNAERTVVLQLSGQVRNNHHVDRIHHLRIVGLVINSVLSLDHV